MIFDSIKNDTNLKKEVDGEVADGKEITTHVVSTLIEATKVSADDKAKFDAFSKDKGNNVLQIFDLSVIVKSNGAEIGKIHETKEPIEYMIAIPDNVSKEGRTFTVVRIYNGVVEELTTTVKDGYAHFSTDKFSTYAITYVDTPPAQVIQPADNGSHSDYCMWFILIPIFVVIFIIIFIIIKRKKKEEEQEQEKEKEKE